MSTAFITILLTNSYLPGALVLADQLAMFHPIIPRVVLISDEISARSKTLLGLYYDEILVLENLIESSNLENLLLFKRPDLKFTLSKINIFNITKFDKLIYYDSDILPLKPLPGTIFDIDLKDAQVAASPDASWPDIFNSGFFILKPSVELFDELSKNLNNSFDGADQGLLNQFFKDWVRLPFLYNVTVNYSVNSYEYLPALNHYKNDIFNAHFIGSRKPWVDRDVSQDSTGFYQKWWDAFNKKFTDLAGEIFSNTESSNIATIPEDSKKPLAFSAGPEGNKLNDSKLVNKWDVEDIEEDEEPALPVDDDASYPPAIFPWESHRVKATRVFGPNPDFLQAGVIEKLHDLDLNE